MKDKGLSNEEQPALRRKPCRPSKNWEDWVIGYADARDPEAFVPLASDVIDECIARKNSKKCKHT